MSLRMTQQVVFIRKALTKAGISTEAIDEKDEAKFIQALKGAAAPAAARQSPPAACSPANNRAGQQASSAKSSLANTPTISAPVADPSSLDSMEARFHGSSDSAERAELFAKLETGFLEAIEAESDPVKYNQLYRRLTKVEESYRN